MQPQQQERVEANMRAPNCLIIFILFSLTLASGPATGQQSGLRLVLNVPKAIAVTGNPDTGYYVLTSDGVVYRYMQSSSGLQFASRFALQTPGDGLDLVVARIDQQDSVIVTQWVQNPFQGFVYRYAPDGKVLGLWKIRHIPTGIVFDPAGHQIYFATFDSNELYKADIKGGEPHVVCSVRGATQLGPLALDSDRKIAYSADKRGALFAVELDSKKVTQLKPSFALPSALLFDGRSRLLYVADHMQKKIYVVDPSAQKSRIIVESAQLTSPSGLASGPENNLVISDEKSGSILLAQIGVPSMPQRARSKPAARLP